MNPGESTFLRHPAALQTGGEVNAHTRYSGCIALYHGPLYQSGGSYETYRPYGLYIREFARRFDRVVVFAPVARRETVYRGFPIDEANVRVAELPDFSTHLSAAHSAVTLFRVFRRELDSVDVINCRNTAPFGSMLYWLARRRGIPFFYHFTSDPWEILNVGPKYAGLKGIAARALYRLAFVVQAHIMRQTFSFVNGAALQLRLRNVTLRMEPIISSTLTCDDFVVERSVDLHRPVRLLYVGYLKHMKGLEYLVEAMVLIRSEGVEAELSLVGEGPSAGELRERVHRYGLESAVRFHGFVADAGALHRHFDAADVFVFPSLSEGSPRVVLEALARGLPVISTPVGSVPEMLKDGESALFVPCRDARALAEAVIRLIRDDGLRQCLSTNGLRIAREHTVEGFVGRLAEKAGELACTRRRR